jgi:predicted nucleic acid-binding protein
VRRIFLDSSVLIAACGSTKGASHAVIVMAEIGLFKVLISKQVLEECERNISKKMIVALPIFREILIIIWV